MGISSLDVNQGDTTDKQNAWAVTSGNKVYDRKKGQNFDNITNKFISLQLGFKLLIDKWQFSYLQSKQVQCYTAVLLTRRKLNKGHRLHNSNFRCQPHLEQHSCQLV